MGFTDGKMLLPSMKFVKSADSGRQTNISELPGAVLTSIFSLVSDPRTRNCMALACRDWYYLERQTRSSLTLRGNVCNLLKLPLCFGSVTTLDLSLCSPWGYSIFQSTTGGELIVQTLHEVFPNVKDLAIYVRDAIDIRTVVWLWPELEAIKLVRWHQRSMDVGMEMGSEVGPLLECPKLRKIDLSEFYCWTEDILPALESGATTASNLRVLNLLKLSPEGFKTQEIVDITAVCKNLEEFFVLCEFDPRFLDSVGDSALECIAQNCPRLRVLHLVDSNEWGAAGCERVNGPSDENANLSCLGLETMARNLPLLQDLALLLAQNVWDSRLGLEALFANCRKLTSLQLSCFHGLCTGPEEGLAAGSSLSELSIKRSVDLSDQSLGFIANGCKKLKKLTLKCCRDISEEGLHTCTRSLSRTLVDVEICGCTRLPSVETLRALEPVRNSIRHLHFDCVWDDTVVAQQAAAVSAGNCATTGWQIKEFDDACFRPQPERKYSVDLRLTDSLGNASPNLGPSGESRIESRSKGVSASDTVQTFSTPDGAVELNVRSNNETNGEASGHPLVKISEASGSGLDRRDSSLAVYLDELGDEQAPDQRCWKSLKTLSLWMDVGFLMSPLPSMGLGRCPSLTEVSIKVEGDCKSLQRPTMKGWGLGALSRYEKFSKLNLDLGEVVSFSLSAPEGQCDLSIWERHYLSGIAELKLRDLDYRPPCDKDLNHRGLSLPAVGHLSQSHSIRKLIVHGSAHAHFLSMLQRNTSLRDFQLRWDYYPAPESETSNEVRVEACRRFEESLAERGLSD
ncbi:unnamed protein product [Calypogeia fissa]